MDIWRYFDVIHGLHTYCNPVSRESVLELEAVLDLQPEMRVLDIASGLGEMLIGFSERHGVSGVGVDISPYAVRRAEARKAKRAPDADLVFVEMGAADYEPPSDPSALFDVVMCIGASWIWNGYPGTLEAMRCFLKPGGLIVNGEPYWRQPPDDRYLEVEELKRDEFPSLAEYYGHLGRSGLSCVWMRGVTEQEWDRYEMLQLASLDRFARESPDDEDLDEIRKKLLPGKEAYFRWGRETLGFAFWVLRDPREPA